MHIISLLITLLLSGLIAQASLAADKLTCGLANAPYQFVDARGEVTGIDADILRAVAKEAGLDLELKAMPWDDAVGMLRMRKLDCVGGMEMSAERKNIFTFTQPLYQRNVALFLERSNKSINKVTDLVGKKVTGDRQSFVETELKAQGLLGKVRIIATTSKEESIRMLKAKQVDAVIAPKAVGLYLAKENHMQVKLLEDSDPGSPVGIATPKESAKYAAALSAGVEKIKNDGALKKIFAKYGLN